MTVRKARRKNARIQLEDKRGAVFAYPNVLGKRFTRREGFGCLCIRDEAKQIRASFQDMETVVITEKIYAHSYRTTVTYSICKGRGRIDNVLVVMN